MVKRCVLELDLNPACADMNMDEFRQFIIDDCFPPIWETMGKIKPTYREVDTVLSRSTRNGSVEVSCTGTTKGVESCTVKGSWSF